MVKAQEVESLGASREAHDLGLVGMQPQPERPKDRRRQFAGLDGLLLGGAQDDQIICVPDQHSQPPPLGRPRLIEDVQRDVGQQR